MHLSATWNLPAHRAYTLGTSENIFCCKPVNPNILCSHYLLNTYFMSGLLPRCNFQDHQMLRMPWKVWSFSLSFSSFLSGLTQIKRNLDEICEFKVAGKDALKRNWPQMRHVTHTWHGCCSGSVTRRTEGLQDLKTKMFKEKEKNANYDNYEQLRFKHLERKRTKRMKKNIQSNEKSAQIDANRLFFCLNNCTKTSSHVNLRCEDTWGAEAQEDTWGGRKPGGTAVEDTPCCAPCCAAAPCGAPLPRAAPPTVAAPAVLPALGSPSPGGEATERQAERAFAAMARPPVFWRNVELWRYVTYLWRVLLLCFVKQKKVVDFCLQKNISPKVRGLWSFSHNFSRTFQTSMTSWHLKETKQARKNSEKTSTKHYVTIM